MLAAETGVRFSLELARSGTKYATKFHNAFTEQRCAEDCKHGCAAALCNEGLQAAQQHLVLVSERCSWNIWHAGRYC